MYYLRKYDENTINLWKVKILKENNYFDLKSLKV